MMMVASKLVSAGWDNVLGRYVWRWSDGSETTTVYRSGGEMYPTLSAAAESVRLAEGWDEIVTSDEYTIGVNEGDRGSAYGVSCYATDAALEDDQDGAYAPRIEVLTGDWQWAKGER